MSKKTAKKKRGRPAWPQDERRSARVQVRVTQGEYNWCQVLADRDGISISEWARAAIQDQVCRSDLYKERHPT